MSVTTTTATTSAAAFARAQAVIPGGVNSPVRAYGNVGGTPRFLASARGAYVTDVDGNEYVDLVGSWGPALLGHAHPEVVEAVREAAGRGLSFGAPTVTEIDLVDEIRSRVPPAEKVRLVSTGTEATMTALRLARAFTGRDLVVKFAGCYHGHVDALLASAGSGVATLGLPDSAGVSAAVTAETIVVPYNDVEAVEAAFAEHGDRIAAVITEAAPANMGVVPPLPGFNAALRRLTLDARRAAHPGRGAHGLPRRVLRLVGARGPARGLGGRPAHVRQGHRRRPAGRRGRWAPGRHGAAGPRRAPSTRRARCPGTRWRPPPAWRRCGSPTRRCTPGSTPSPRSCAASSTAALSAEGLPHAVQWAGNLFSTFFGADAAAHGARDYAAVLATESWRYAPFFHVAARVRRVRTAVAVRGVVRVRRARRRRGRPDRLGPPGRRPRRRAGHGTDRLRTTKGPATRRVPSSFVRGSAGRAAQLLLPTSSAAASSSDRVDRRGARAADSSARSLR